MTYGEGTLSLIDLAPATLFLSDGGDVVGFQTTGQFLDSWYEATSGPVTRSLAAVLALLIPGQLPGSDARLLLSLPRIHGTGLAYQVLSIEGSLAAAAGACVLFLDPVRAPVTPTGTRVTARL
jgi:hypothetical protein